MSDSIQLFNSTSSSRTSIGRTIGSRRDILRFLAVAQKLLVLLLAARHHLRRQLLSTGGDGNELTLTVVP
jgi:hypothetical protein